MNTQCEHPEESASMVTHRVLESSGKLSPMLPGTEYLCLDCGQHIKPRDIKREEESWQSAH